MSTLDATRAELALVILYSNKPKAREKICKAIQYGLKFWSDGQPGTAQNVDKSTSLARKVFHLFKSVNDLHALISPAPQGTPLPLILLGKRIGWKLVYVDHENHVLLVGDDPWEEFVNWVHCIKILYPQEVKQMRLDGDIGNSLLQKEVCNSVLLVSHG